MHPQCNQHTPKIHLKYTPNTSKIRPTLLAPGGGNPKFAKIVNTSRATRPKIGSWSSLGALGTAAGVPRPVEFARRDESVRSMGEMGPIGNRKVSRSALKCNPRNRPKVVSRALVSSRKRRWPIPRSLGGCRRSVEGHSGPKRTCQNAPEITKN